MSNDYDKIKALSNEKRYEIYQFIRESRISIKSDILNHFKMNRASLDHHMEFLLESGLISVLDVNINKRKYSFVLPKTDVSIDSKANSMEELKRFIPENLTNELYLEMAENLWFKDKINKLDVECLMSQIAEKLDLKAWELFCRNCREKIAIMKCSSCDRLVCNNCAEIITKENEEKVIFCENCIEERFS